MARRDDVRSTWKILPLVFAVIWGSAICATNALGAGQVADVDKAVQTIYSLCVAGGERLEISGGAGAGADLTFRKFDANGHVGADLKVRKSQVQGLVDGLNNKMNSVTAEQADKVRQCIEPYRRRIMNMVLPPDKHSINDAPHTRRELARVDETKASQNPKYIPPTEAAPTGEDRPKESVQNADLEWRSFDNVEFVFGFNDARDQSLLVSVIRLVGYNRSGRPIRNVNAYVTPLLNGNLKLPMGFVTRDGLLNTKDADPIPPGAEISVAYIIPASDSRNKQGISIEEYLVKYGGFEFNFDFDGKHFSHVFPYEKVESMLLEHQKQYLEQIKPFPEIKRKTAP